jgi:pyruvate ferredoxin oxidoreductase gamma subunit
MSFIKRIRFHGRGGQGAKVASRALGSAAFYEGYYAQDFPLYGAERRGAPISAFTRISDEPILERGIISEPDIVTVMDETLLSDPAAMPLSGVKEGGVVFINTTYQPDKAKARYKISANVITLDLTKIGIDMLGAPVLSALAGGAAARISGLSVDSLKKAVEKEISEITTDRVLIEKNIDAALYCFNSISPIEITETASVQKASPVIPVPFEPALISSPAINAKANTPLRKTGNWRLFKPVWDHEKCTKCMMCVVSCPDGCISVNPAGLPNTSYENCKGCLICVEVCPSEAIEAVREVHAG